MNAVELNDIQRKFGLSAGINFSLPIYDGSQKKLTQQQAEIFIQSIDAYKQNQIVTLVNKLSQAKTGTEFYAKNLENLYGQLESYERLLKLAHAEYLRGQRSMTEYIILM